MVKKISPNLRDKEKKSGKIRGLLRVVVPKMFPIFGYTLFHRPNLYSTVTDFAKLRGLSTSVPLATATW